MSRYARKTWWCGTSLSTGVKVVAVVNLFFSLALIVGEVVLYLRKGVEDVSELKPEFPEAGLDTMLSINIVQRTNFKMVDPKTDGKSVNNSRKVGTADAKEKPTDSLTTLQLVVSLIWIVTWILSIFFSLLLYHAAVHRNRRNCAIWFYYRALVLIFRVIFLIVFVLIGFPILLKIPVIFLFVIGIYSLWLVNEFINELTEEQRQESTPHKATADNASFVN